MHVDEESGLGEDSGNTWEAFDEGTGTVWPCFI